MLRWLSVAVLWALGGVAITAVVVAFGTPAVEEDVLARRVQEIGPWFEPVSVFVRWLTHTAPVIGLGVLLAAALIISGERRRAIRFGVLLLVMALLQTGIKEALDRERPSPAYVEVRDTWASPSYPAGHLMSGTFLWGYLVLAAAPRGFGGGPWNGLRAFHAAVVVVNIPANVYMGVHWPTDVVGGLLLGASLMAVVLALEARERGPG